MTIQNEIAALEAALPKGALSLTEKQAADLRRSLMLEELADLRNLNLEWKEAMHFGWCCNPEGTSDDDDPMGDHMGRNY